MKFLKPDLLFLADTFADGLGLWLDDNGKILEIADPNSVPEIKIEYVEGLLVPGFINTHCHLELSHLKGVIPQKTGLPEFGMGVVRNRNLFSEKEILASIESEIQSLKKSGTVALGDISNQGISANAKRLSGMYIHTFVELLGLNPSHAAYSFEKGMEILPAFEDGFRCKASLAGHAPYSVSKELLQLIANQNLAQDQPSTIHFLESQHEIDFFKDKTGGFVSLYEKLSLNISFFQPKKTDSVEWCSEFLQSAKKCMLVHNTYITELQIEKMLSLSSDIYFCLCPRANLYIENRLPPVSLFQKKNLKITLGTDSLASNEDLNLLNEIKVIQQNFPSLTLHEMLIWATENGAEFLGLYNQLGDFTPGKTPGINLISGLNKNTLKLETETKIQALFSA